MKSSLIVPIYKNEANIPALIATVTTMSQRVGSDDFEVVFVVDGSPDSSYMQLRQAADALPFPVQLLAHSRNFGSFAAIRSGLRAARGEFFGVMAADLQEPPELLEQFFAALEADECDVVIGARAGRDDPLMSRLTSNLFWGMYRRFLIPDMPAGGVDVFGCNRVFRDHLLALEESRSSLIALIFWLGFRRKFVPYERCRRQDGKSTWTLRKKIDYMFDSVFSFTDYPIRLLLRLGFAGSLASIVIAVIVLLARLMGEIDVPGYAPTMIAVLFLGALNLLGLGLVGSYAWRAYENSKSRPLAIVATRYESLRSRE
jgi:glycosyltransferase involved in cell wall biosynthesis